MEKCSGPSFGNEKIRNYQSLDIESFHFTKLTKVPVGQPPEWIGQKAITLSCFG